MILATNLKSKSSRYSSYDEMSNSESEKKLGKLIVFKLYRFFECFKISQRK